MNKVWEARLRWFGHVQCWEEEDCLRRILEAEVHGQRSRGRQRNRWINVMKYNMEDLRVDLMDVENRAEWRRRTRLADSSPKGSKPAWRRERERVLVRVRDQPNSRKKMHDFTAEFLKCVKCHGKFTDRVSQIHGPHRRYFEVLRYCKQRNFRTTNIYYTQDSRQSMSTT